MIIIILELKGQFILVDKNGWFVQFFGERKLGRRNKEEDWEEREEDSKRSEQSKRRREFEEQGGKPSTWSLCGP